MVSSAEINTLARAIIQAMPKADNILTAEKVAEILDRPLSEVNKMCNDGTIKASKLGRKWYVSERMLMETLFPSSQEDGRSIK